MPSQIITPPDRIHSPQSFLIINAIDTSIETLILWLQTVPDEFDLHLYHNGMSAYHDWAIQIAAWAKKILVESSNAKYMVPRLCQTLSMRADIVTYFGTGTQYPELVNYFLKHRYDS